MHIVTHADTTVELMTKLFNAITVLKTRASIDPALTKQDDIDALVNAHRNLADHLFD